MQAPKITRGQPPGVKPASFFDRLRIAEDARVKRLLGYYIATHLVQSGDGIFVLSGTTPCFAAEQIMSTVENVSIFTTSIPVLWAAMKLNQGNCLARGVTVRVPGGDTHLLSGLICNSNFRSFPGEKLIYSPRSLTPRGIEGNQDINYIRAGLAVAREIILPITDDKLGRRANVVIKYLGHITKESSDQKRRYSVILPYTPPSTEQEEPSKSILAAYRDAGVKIIRLSRDFAIPENASDIFSSEKAS